jgi:hypothetical protein
MDPRHLPSDFREFLECLNAAGAENLLIGGHAVAYHGYPRTTSDMDIWVNRTLENAVRVVAAVQSFFGLPMDGLTVAQLLNPENVTHCGIRPFFIEILNRVSGGDFADAWEHRIETAYDGVPTRIIALADLRQNKSASGRHKHIADLENLPNA